MNRIFRSTDINHYFLRKRASLSGNKLELPSRSTDINPPVHGTLFVDDDRLAEAPCSGAFPRSACKTSRVGFIRYGRRPDFWISSGPPAMRSVCRIKDRPLVVHIGQEHKPVDHFNDSSGRSV